jgi:hypothetical protein
LVLGDTLGEISIVFNLDRGNVGHSVGGFCGETLCHR